MTKRKLENNREQAVIDTPVSTDTYKETALFQANEILSEVKAETTASKEKKAGACNEIVQLFKGFTKTNCESKKKALFIESNIRFKAKKGVVRKDAISLTPTASAVISTAMRYVREGNTIEDTTTYSKLKTHFLVKPSKAETKNLKTFKNHSTENQAIALDLLKDYLNEKRAKEQAEFEAKQETKKETPKASITRTKNTKKTGAMAGATA